MANGTGTNTATNVMAGKPNVTGSIFRAPLSGSPTIPTDATTDLAAAFKCLGYVSEDGLTNNLDIENEEVKAWGGDTVLNINTGKSDKFKFTLLEAMNEDVLKAVHVDSNVSVTAATSSAPKKIDIQVNNKDQVECCWVVELVTRSGNPKRIVIPNGKITEIGGISYKDDDAVGYEITISAMADSSGNTHYEYMTVGTATGT